MAGVVLSEVYKRYGKVEAVHGISLDIKDKEFIVFVGPSGCGKSTTLRMIAGLETISQGTVKIGDRVVNDIAPKDRSVAMVFQNYALYPHMNVYDNMSFGLKLKKHPKDVIETRVNEAAKILGLTDLLKRKPFELSGGQRQRVAMGRAIVRKPAVFLFDEPLSNLDAKLRTQMRAEIKRLHQKVQSTIIYVTHDQVEAMSLSDRIAIMDEGKLSQVGTPLEVYAMPKNIFVAGFIGSPSINLIPAFIREKTHALIADLGPFRCVIPEKFREACRPYRDRQVTLGIRPEHIHERGSIAPDLPDADTAEAMVEVVEPLGDRNIVEATMDGIALTVVTDATVEAAPGRSMSVIFDMDRAHIFDSDTGENILYPPESSRLS